MDESFPVDIGTFGRKFSNPVSPTRVRTTALPTTSTAFFIKAPPAPPPSAHGSDVESDSVDVNSCAEPSNYPSQDQLSHSRDIFGETQGAQTSVPTSVFSLSLMDEALSRVQRGDMIPEHGRDRRLSRGENTAVATSSPIFQGSPSLKDESYFMLKMRAWEERRDRISKFVRERRNDDRLPSVSVASGNPSFSERRRRGTKRSYTECEGSDSEGDVPANYDSDEYPCGDFLVCDEPQRDAGLFSSTAMDMDDEPEKAPSKRNPQPYYIDTGSHTLHAARSASGSSSLTCSTVSTPCSAFSFSALSHPSNTFHTVWPRAKDNFGMLPFQESGLQLTGNTFGSCSQHSDLD